jgi:hypothetical protein
VVYTGSLQEALWLEGMEERQSCASCASQYTKLYLILGLEAVLTALLPGEGPMYHFPSAKLLALQLSISRPHFPLPPLTALDKSGAFWGQTRFEGQVEWQGRLC